MITTRDFKITFLGVVPEFKNRKGSIPSQEIVSFSAWSSFKGKSFQRLLREIKRKKQDPSKKSEVILKNSSLRGHSSIATTPVFCFSYEGSKFLDSALTGMTFSSALMASGRRTETDTDDIIYPSSVLKKRKTREIYREASVKNIEFSNFLLENNIPKDEASKILQYGIYGTGIIQFPIESVVSLKREYESEKEWMPEEIGILLKKIESYFKKTGVDLIYASRVAAPRNTYFYPNIFKDPHKSNLAGQLGKNIKPEKLFEIVSKKFLANAELKKRLNLLERKIKKAVKEKKIKSRWKDLLKIRRQITRDYNLSVILDIVSRVSWRVWGEKKRHRTVPMVVDSIYSSIEEAEKILRKLENKILSRKLNESDLKKIDFVFSLPREIKKHKEFLYLYLERGIGSFRAYRRLLSEGVLYPDALFVIPRAVKINVLQSYDLYNLIAGYYPLRLCSTVEEELRELTIKEAAAIKGVLKKNNLDFLAKHISPKCYAIGFCPEREKCRLINSLVPYYNEKLHTEMMNFLSKEFQKLKDN